MILPLLIAAFILFPGAASGEITDIHEYQPPIRDWTLRHYAGATFYVDDDTCPDPGSGTEADPYCAIQEGIDAGVSGDLVLVAAGTYVENLRIHYKGITLQSEAGPDLTIIEGAFGTILSFEGTATGGALVDGFTLRYGFSAGDGGAIFCNSHADPTIMNCTITNNFASNGGGLRCEINSSPKIIDCIFSENSATVLGGAISCYEDSHAKVTNCIINDNYAPYGGGISCTIYSKAKITHSTISSNNAAIWGGGVTSYFYANIMITDSIIWNNSAPLGPDIYQGNWSYPEVAYSDIQGGWPGEGNIDENPLFLGAADYHLSEGSPCIDTGTDAEVDTDLDGDPRPSLTGFDMGADEYTGDCWDLDGDGYQDARCGDIDCNDADPLVNPGAWEIQDDGFDNDCDGFTDEPGYGDVAPLGGRDGRTIAPDITLATKGILYELLLTRDDTELLDVAPFVICDESSFPVLISPAPDSSLNYLDMAVILQAASGYMNLVPHCPE